MEKKIEKCSLGIIAKLPHLLNAEEKQKEWGNQFMVAFYIINTMAIKKTDRVKIYRQQLADNCNFKNPKSITNITNKLDKIGIIKKDFIGDAETGKTYNYYSLNWSKISELVEQLDEECKDWWNSCTHLKNERITRIKEKQEDKNRLVKTSQDKTSLNVLSNKSIDDVGKTLGGDFTKSSSSDIEKLIDDELKHVTTFEENRIVATELRKVIPYKYKELIDRKVGEKVEFIRALVKT